MASFERPKVSDNFIQKGRSVIEKAEREIHQILEQAVHAREYESVPRLASFAERLQALRGGDAEPSHLRLAQDDLGALAGASTRETTQPAGSAPLPGHAASGAEAFPIFRVEGDDLVKVGWSKSKSTTYEHRAPKRVVMGVLQRALSLTSSPARPFTAEALSDVGTHDDALKIAGYQLYLCLAWMRRTGIIRRHGRKGYSVTDPDSALAEVKRAWEDIDQGDSRSSLDEGRS